MSGSLSPLERLVFHTVLRSYPTAFRNRFHKAIEETFRDRLLEAREHRTRWRFLWRFARNGLVSGLHERFRPSLAPRLRPASSGSLPMKQTLGQLVNDFRLAVRALRRRPAFAFAAAGTLALGFGANTAIFSVVNGVLLRPLGFIEPERLVSINVAPDEPGGVPFSMSYPDIADILEQAPSLETLVGLNGTRQTLTGLGEPRVLELNRLTRGLMDTFQTAPLLGRDIQPSEFGDFLTEFVVVVSYAFWQNTLGADPDVIGRTITLDGNAWEVVGVAPRGFDFPDGVDAWRPRFLNTQNCGRGCHTMGTIGRLAPGATVAALQAELDQIATRLEQAYPETNTGKRFLVRSLHDFVVSDVRQGLTILMLAVVLVLLIACANVANLLLASAVSREGEMALRAALGAGRARLMSQVFSESLVLSGVGAISGLLLATVGLRGFKALAANTIPRLEEVSIDGTVLAWTLGAAMAVTFLFGLIPAFTVSRTAATRVARTGRTAGSERHAIRFRAGLMSAEVALSTALLIGAGLLFRTFSELYRVDLGYETENIVRFRVSLPPARYGSLEQVRVFYRTLESEIAATPSVQSVASVFGPPFGGGSVSGDVLIAGRPEPAPGEERSANVHGVSPGYFKTMGMHILRGRALDASDDTGGEAVAVVNEAFVREHFPDEDPIGKRVRISVDMGFGSPEWRIVGVVGDIRSRSLEATASSMAYVPHGVFGPEDMYVVVRATDAPQLIPSIRTIMQSLDPDLPMYSIETFDDVLRRQLAPTTLYLSLVSSFAVLAAILAAVGLYSVVSYIVSSRSREIGVRLALGAGRPRVMRYVITRGLQPVAVGLLAGLVIASVSGRVLESVLYGVRPRDVLTFVGATGFLIVVAIGAVTMPALRASRLNPTSTLRGD